MKRFVWYVVFTCVCIAGDIAFKGNIGFECITYTKAQNDCLLKGKDIIDFRKERVRVHAEADFFYSRFYHVKRRLYLNELYALYEYKNYRFKLGKALVFWGELEGYNIVDVFNPKNTTYDPFDTLNKIGSWSFLANYFYDDSRFEIGVKFYEPDNRFFDKHSPYYVLPGIYDKNLHVQNRYAPTVHFKYQFTVDEPVESEMGIVLQTGYDNKRYFAPDEDQLFAQFAYKAQKVLIYGNVLLDDITFKFEGAYTDVINNDLMSNYRQVGVGLEKGPYMFEDVEATLYSEYYYYDYINEKTLKNVDISELYDNDIFLAVRLTFNDTHDSELKMGILKDLDNYESIFKMQYKMRIGNNSIARMELLHFSKSFQTYPNLSNHTRIKIAWTYYF